MQNDTKDKFITNEFYELPNNYNKTSIHLLAQTPKILFVYWELSAEDADNLRIKYGDNFFDETRPILIINNLTNNSKFEIEINDFARSWYISVPDSSCKFEIELARKPINDFNNYYNVQIAKSNELESPNDHILTETLKDTVEFKNIKNGDTYYKQIDSKSYKTLYKIYDDYKEKYNDESYNNPSSK